MVVPLAAPAAGALVPALPVAKAAAGVGVAKLLKAAGVLSTLGLGFPLVDYFSEDSLAEDLASKTPGKFTGKVKINPLDRLRFAISGAGGEENLNIREFRKQVVDEAKERQEKQIIKDRKRENRIKDQTMTEAQRFEQNKNLLNYNRLIQQDADNVRGNLAELGLRKQDLSNSLAVSLAELDLREQAQKREMERFYEMQRIAREDKQYERRKAMIYALSALGEIPFL